MINTLPFMIGIGIFCAIAATVVLFILVLPDKKRERLPKVLKIVHDLFNFKSLMIEKILQALYVFSTLACVLVGFFMLFGFRVYDGYFADYSMWYGGYGLLVMLLGPIIIRVIFEAMMMFILLVKNTIEINNKLKGQTEEPVKFEAPAEAPTEE